MIRLFLICLSLFYSAAAYAADIRLGGDASLNCQVTLTGEVTQGDADRLLAMFEEVFARYTLDDETAPETQFGKGDIRLCLNSPGGNFTEALRIGDMLAYQYPHLPYHYGMIGTAVPDGAVCTSSCALIFMAGGYFSAISATGFREPDRQLHLNGRLGFHAPGLAIAEGEYTQAQVEKAFDIAVRSINELAERLERYQIYPRLFQTIVSTPPSDMSFVETTGHAGSWRIQLAGAARPSDISATSLRNVCTNLNAYPFFAFGAEYRYGEAAPASIRDGARQLFGTRRFGVDGLVPWDGFPQETLVVNGDRTAFEYDTCFGAYFPDTGKIIFNDADAAGGAFPPGQIRNQDHTKRTYWQDGDDLRPGEDGAWMLYPSWTQLADLWAASQSSPGGVVEGSRILTPVFDHFSARCAGYRGDQRSKDADCQFAVIGEMSADGNLVRERYRITWPGDLTTDYTRESYNAPLVPGDPSEWRYAGSWRDLHPDNPAVDDLYNDFGLSACFERLSNGILHCADTDRFESTTMEYWDR